MTNTPSSSISRRLRYILLFIAVPVCAFIWFQFSYPRFSNIDLSVSKAEAIRIATEHVQSKERVDLSSYHRSVIFDVSTDGDRYLQKSMGFDAEEKFIKEHQLDLFFWSFRFFKEGKKEEFRVVISSKTGEVVSYSHILEDTAFRESMSEDEAEKKARDFLIRQFNVNFDAWAFNAKTNIKFDNRTDYTFSWEKKNVDIRWSPDPKSGTGKLTTMVVVSGDDILAYNKQTISIPDEFYRYLDRAKESGRNLGLVSNIGSLFLLIGAIWVVMMRRNHLAMNRTKGFYTKLIVFLFILSVLSAFNNAQGYIYGYPTTQPFAPFFIRQAIYEVIERFLFYICFIIPCLAGELLRFEIFPKRPQMSMFHYVTTTFLSRDVTRIILLGYCFAVVMIGLQTSIFEFGYRYCDVWMEQSRLSRFSSAYFPFFGVLILAINASISEEALYRLFGVNFSIKFFRSVALGVLIPSIIWGLGHTGYNVFPFWFRGLEVTILGIFSALVYLRFGLIAVVVQHFVFDAFWAGAPYIFGKSPNSDFWMSLFVVGIPFMIAVIALIANRTVEAKSVRWQLNDAQRFNMEILKDFIRAKSQDKSFNAQALRAELIRYGWDIAVIDVAFQDLNIGFPEENRG